MDLIAVSRNTVLVGYPLMMCAGSLTAFPPFRTPKDTEGQVQAKAPSGGELDLVVVQRAVREDTLLNGCLHRALQREE